MEDNTDVSRGTAYRFMAIAKNWDAIEIQIDGSGRPLGVMEATQLISQDRVNGDVVDEVASEEEFEEDDLTKLLSPSLQRSLAAGTVQLSDKVLKKITTLSHTDQNRVARDVRVGNESSFERALGLARRVRSESEEEATARARKAKKEKNKDKVAKDGHGKALPNPQLVKVFRDERFKEAQTLLKRLRKRVNSIRGCSGQFIVSGQFAEACDRVEAILTNGTPKYLCPSCSGATCPSCRNAGWVPAYRYQEITMGKETE